MLRLFTGIFLPPALKLSLSALTGGLPGARWVDPGNYHVTLRFIGEVDEALAADIDGALARIEVPRFEIALAGIGTFGERQLWVGIERNDALIRLRDKIESALVRLRLEPEGRRFQPHVTLARLKRADARLRDFIAGNSLYRAPPFPVRHFSLIASYQTKAGSVYEDRADYRLT
ncbi:MAG TPA: RNA 2',3'-cyclic phosphodiesterase [Stellaceae bacterium]|nr:RNA 2',3'-cyclic phosphodiesterase [Stellaceae bacterium]